VCMISALIMRVLLTMIVIVLPFFRGYCFPNLNTVLKHIIWNRHLRTRRQREYLLALIFSSSHPLSVAFFVILWSKLDGYISLL
jgi:hypothetical protein